MVAHDDVGSVGVAAWRGLERDLCGLSFLVAPAPEEAVTRAELDALPPAAQAWAGFHGVAPGQRKRGSFRAAWRGRFRTGPRRPWMTIEAVQLTMAAPIRRWFYMTARIAGVLPIEARDTYVGGCGHMVAKLARVVTVADGRGVEFDRGELVTWVNDCVLFAPSMLLHPGTTFSDAGANAFDVSATDWGQTVTARVLTDDRGAPVDFETNDRYLNDPDHPGHPLVRCRWRTPIGTWARRGSLVYPSSGKAIWDLPRGPYVYAEFQLVPEALVFDPPPLSGR